MNRFAQFALLLLALSVLLMAGTACKSPDSENLSSRPWNTPRGYDTGLPGFDQPR
jgi:hypothetical protein